MRRVAPGLVLLCALAVVPLAHAGASAQTLEFDVFLGEQRIGEQRFALSSTTAGLRVETAASFKVKLLRITAFAYAHRNVEQWRAGCLQSIESTTDSNGKLYRVSGRQQQDGFRVDGAQGAQVLSGCVGTFAYWDQRQLLGRQRLLNSQTGEHVTVTTEKLADSRLRLGGRDVAVERYALRGAGIDLTVSYAGDSGEWLGLDSRLEGGRVLSYRRAAREQYAAGL